MKQAKFKDPTAVFEGKPPREAPPPSKWGRSKLGHDFVVRKVGYRNVRGQKLYKLGFLNTLTEEPGRALYSSQTWTLEQLNAQGVQWLDRCPVATLIEEPDRDPIPDGMARDDDDEPEAQTIGIDVAAEQVLKHRKSGNLYRVHQNLGDGTAVVSQVLPDGRPTPKRKLALAGFEA